MMRRWKTVVMGLALAAATGVGPDSVHAKPAGETGGRHLGSRISSGSVSNHTCVVKEDGTVQCWGSNASGQLGNGSSGPAQFETSPVQVSGLSDAVAVAAGTSHTCALRANGTVSCWGANGSGRLGDGTTTTRTTPVAVLNPDGTTLSGVVAVTAGLTHTCAVRVDGTARCWGSNSNGRLGNGNTSISSSAFASAVTSLPDAVAITAGSDHTCAVRIGGGVRCWGANFSGQLGIGSTDNGSHATPLDIPGLVEITTVQAGGSHTCGLRSNGQVRCWGSNGFGQVGDGTTASPRTSAATVTGLGGVIAIALGQNHSCARRADGDVRCWGRNDQGQLGDLGSALQQPEPVSVVSQRTCSPTAGCTFIPLSAADGIAAGQRHACSLQADESVRCWGGNDLGQLGTGDTAPQSFFAPAVTGLAGSIGARFISAGTAQTCARRADGTVACWGSDLTPAPVAGMTSTLSVATGASHKCALGSDGRVRCVGSNQQGQIGNGAGGPGAPDVTDPAQGLVTGLTDVAAVVSGNNFSCALRSTGSVRCWGANAFGQLGDGASGFNAARIETSPVTVQGLSDIIALTAGKEHACAVRVGGTVHCWGRNVFGQVGAAATNTLVTAPFQVSVTNAVAVAAGPDHSCALLLSGGARCWGKNDVGQLGNSQVDFDDFFGAGAHPTPDSVDNLTDAVALTAGGSPGPSTPSAPVRSRDFTCARRAGGSVRCWGDNAFGQLGDNSTTDHTSPQTSVFRRSPINPNFLVSLAGVAAVTAGDLFGCALLESGIPFCWGSGNSTIAVQVSSFGFNIDRNVALIGRDRVARVTILANCPEGERVQVNASLTQGDVVGRGTTVGACTGELERYEMIVPAHGRGRFEPGPAVVEAEAFVRSRGVVVDEHEWTRAVQLTP
jgi:alpha-tubulin suppressor-like RCC1 family protein